MSKSNEEIQDVKVFFDGYAADFDSIYGHTNKRGLFDKLMDKFFRKSMYTRYTETLKNTGANHIHSILDVGCGGGHYCEAFLKQGKKVTGLDIAPGMLKIAEQKTAKWVKEGKAEYVLDGYLEHKFNHPFDSACLMGFFDYIKEPLPVLQKLNQDVTKEVYMSFPKAGGFLAWQRKVRYNMRNCPLYYYSKSDLEHLMQQAGWKKNAEIKDLGRDFFVKVTLN